MTDAPAAAVADASRFHEIAVARVKHISALTEMGFRQLVLLDGGATIALFTLLGHFDSIRVEFILVWWAFACFAASIGATMLSVFLVILAQNAYFQADRMGVVILHPVVPDAEASDKWKNRDQLGAWLRNFGICTAAIAAGLFLLGCAFALSSVQSVEHAPTPKVSKP